MLLSPVGWLYGKIADIRNALYDRGTFRSYSLGAKTVSIGNITTGGTGKTPLVAYVAEILSGEGEKVCILTRGYGRESSGRVLVSDGEQVVVDARTGGDEPVELARKLIGKAIVVADSDRVSAAAWAKEKFGITTFVLDDGFQHRRAKRDLDIVCVDATDPDGGGTVLPAGRLRERFEYLSRADAVVLTRTDLVEGTREIEQRIRRRNSKAPIFISRTKIASITSLKEHLAGRRNDRPLDWSPLRDCGDFTGDNEVRVLAFCALGNPDAFFRQLDGAFEEESMRNEFDLSVIKKFPDHHRYTQSDIDELERAAANVHALLTTVKDAVKLDGLGFEIPCFVVETDIIINDPAGFRDLVISS